MILFIFILKLFYEIYLELNDFYADAVVDKMNRIPDHPHSTLSFKPNIIMINDSRMGILFRIKNPEEILIKLTKLKNSSTLLNCVHPFYPNMGQKR